MALGISNQSYLLLGQEVQVYYLLLRYPQNWAFPCPIRHQILTWLPLWPCHPQARGPQLTPRPLRPNSRILMSPKERNTPKKLGLGENPMKNYWFDLFCYSAINGVCLMYLENFAAHEINFKSQFTNTQRFHIFGLIIAHLHSFKILKC